VAARVDTARAKVDQRMVSAGTGDTGVFSRTIRDLRERALARVE